MTLRTADPQSPTAAAPISPSLPTVQDTPQIRLDSSPDGATMSVCTADGRWLRLHSGRDPIAEADRLIAPAFASGEPPLVVVIGLGLGYVLDAIERRSTITRVLAIEPVAAAVPHMLARRDWATWTAGGRLVLLTGPEYSGSGDAWRLVETLAVAPPVIVNPILKRECPMPAATAVAVAERVLYGARANAEARRRFAGPYLLNTLGNLPTIVTSADIDALADQFTGIPAVVVAAGPSLDHHVPDLARLGERAVVISVATAWKALRHAGVDPHFVVAVDPGDPTERLFRGLPADRPSWLIAEGSLHPAAFGPFPGRAFTFQVSGHEPWPWLAGLGVGRGRLRAWGSVTVSAFDLAVRMGCDPVTFVGADLAFTGGQPYCRNTAYEDQWREAIAEGATLEAQWERLRTRHTAVTVPDIHGQPTETTSTLVAFRDALVDHSVRSGRRVINATGGGILGGVGVEQMDLADVPLGPAGLDLRSTIDAAWRASASGQRATETAVRTVLDTRADTGLPVGGWRAFTLNTVSAGRLLATVDRARRGMASRAAHRPTEQERSVPTMNPLVIVGNGQGALAEERGAWIDQHQTVLRMNIGYPSRHPAELGTRTDILAISYNLAPDEIFREFNPSLVVVCSPLHDRFPALFDATLPDGDRLAGVRICYPTGWWEELREQLEGHRPTTGAMILWACAKFGIRADVVGFDFLKTRSWYDGPRPPAPHAGEVEERLARRLEAEGWITIL